MPIPPRVYLVNGQPSDSFARRLRQAGEWVQLLLCAIGMLTLTSQVAAGATVLRAEVFNTTGVSTAPNEAERIGTLASKLPEQLNADQIDVACLNELWEPEIRTIALSGIVNNPDWHVYQPEPVAQSGCAHACVDQPFPNDTIHPIINQWAQSCTLTVLPQLGSACADLTGLLKSQQCLSEVCPDFLPYVGVKNPSCAYCLADDRTPTETNRERIFRCTDFYDASSADLDLGVRATVS